MQERLILKDADHIRESVTMGAVIESVREAFIGYARGEFECPQRLNIADGRFLVMPVHHLPTHTLAVKTLSLNSSREPSIGGTVSWEESDSHRRFVADAAEATAMRTGAASAVATDLCASKDASRLAVIGAGGQAADQIRAVSSVRNISEVTVCARHLESADELIRAIADEYPQCEFRSTADASEAVSTAEVICCVTPSTEPLFSLRELRGNTQPNREHSGATPRVHINLIGSFQPHMKEIDPAEFSLVPRGNVIVDEWSAVMEEAGEIIEAEAAGVISRGDCHELGEALIADREFTGITVFKSVGLAIQDWAFMNALARSTD